MGSIEVGGQVAVAQAEPRLAASCRKLVHDRPRLAAEPPGSRARALAETGSAVALCSTTTIIGYSSLFIASNGALRSFGKLADLGEIGCLLAALLFVPSMAGVTERTKRQALDDSSRS